MDEKKFAWFLLSLDRFQKRLAEFMLGRYLEFDFSGDREDDRLAVTLAFSEAGITVEAFVRLDLERDMGAWPAGVHIPYRRHAEGLDLDEALAFVEARVGELCQRYDDAARLGLVPR
ncbi:hypothetical protein [Streptomyces canus]|uniref:hypothetical protein n=1 Tax=Streptomyces canus TaxID=58343 RepID=UPI0027849B72|nr:hypothetical protein [Streptomyces canus]MDQ0762819.1 hypothetical protein [Streptomyces canus]MDQ1068723.1 hypothetical protein [Streptomyces canus]